MRIKSYFSILTTLVLVIIFSSCASRKDVAYFQDVDTLKSVDSLYEYNTVIQPNDLINITVTAADPQAARPYNLLAATQAASGSSSPTIGSQQLAYLVDNSGNIEFPELGTIKVGGLSRKQLIDYLIERISVFVKNPIVNVNILNFKVTVLGEVKAPRQFDVAGERITVLEALGMAGDLTIFGRRDNVLIIRDTDGKKTHERIDLTKTDFINSDFYYLKQNDLVYVEPNKTAVNSSRYSRNTGLYVSALSILITLYVIFFK